MMGILVNIRQESNALKGLPILWKMKQCNKEFEIGKKQSTVDSNSLEQWDKSGDMTLIDMMMLSVQLL